MKTKKWKPKRFKLYWYIDKLGEAKQYVWENYVNVEDDKILYKIGNCFKTKKEALAMSKKFKKLLKNK